MTARGQICSALCCHKEVHARGLCNKHRQRLKTWGNCCINPNPFKWANNKKHGMKGTKEYAAWCGLKGRVLNCNSKDYKNYMGRGISVCKEWKESFIAFYNDMGDAPTGKHQIDRIDNDGDYEANNCRWTDSTTNMRNSRTTKLKEFEVKEIRVLLEVGELSHGEIAQLYNISRPNVSLISENKLWRI